LGERDPERIARRAAAYVDPRRDEHDPPPRKGSRPPRPAARGRPRRAHRAQARGDAVDGTGDGRRPAWPATVRARRTARARVSPVWFQSARRASAGATARSLARHLSVPAVIIEPTGEPASFSPLGNRRGWSNAAPGHGHGRHPARTPSRPARRDRRDGEGWRRPLLQGSRAHAYGRGAAAAGADDRTGPAAPLLQASSHTRKVDFVMTANDFRGLAAPLQCRCMVLDLAESGQDGVPRPGGRPARGRVGSDRCWAPRSFTVFRGLRPVRGLEPACRGLLG
jgi:hypothetical protein